MYLSPAHYGGKLHVIINVIFSLLVLFSLWTDCICECRSAKHFKMKKNLENPLRATSRLSDNLLIQCRDAFSSFLSFTLAKLKLRNWGAAGFCGTLQWVTSWLSRGASNAPGESNAVTNNEEAASPHFQFLLAILLFLSLPQLCPSSVVHQILNRRL